MPCNNPNHLDNLVNIPPGVSGNPKGRPKGSRTIITIVREMLELRTIRGKPLPNGMTVAESLADVMLVHALKGDFRYVKELLDRVEGKVVDRHEVTGAEGGPIEIDATAREQAANELETWRRDMKTRLELVLPSTISRSTTDAGPSEN